MIEVTVRKVKLTKSILRQMVVKFGYVSFRDAAVVIGWFNGEATLGREYSNSPYILCVNSDGDPFLYRAEVYKMDGTVLKAGNREIAQVFV